MRSLIRALPRYAFPFSSASAKPLPSIYKTRRLGHAPLRYSLSQPLSQASTGLTFGPRTGRLHSIPAHNLRPLRSSSSSLLFILPLVAGALVLYHLGFSETKSAALDLEVVAENAVGGADEFETMTMPPGRVGNLTPEQEEKLAEFWRLIFQICAIEDDAADDDAADDEAAASIQTPSSTTSQEKSKKKRLGLFKKKDKKDKKDKENNSEKAVSALGNLKDNDPDDKYGHNKIFQETLATRTAASIRSSLWSMIKMDHPDQLVLRFLRARKWDVEKALIMLVSTMKWRQDSKVDDDIMVNGEEHLFLQEKQGATEAEKTFARDFMAQCRMGKSFTRGIDKEGRPITVVRVRLHHAGDQLEESLERYTVYLIETNRNLLEAPVDTGTVIFDMTGFGMANMDYTPVKFMIQCFEANYPESLGVVLVHKAPWIFQGIWKVIKGWLDPVVASKVHFTNNFKDLSEFITPSKIPVELDGEDPWVYKYVEPVLGENAKLKDTATRDKLLEEREGLYDEYERRTWEWIKEKDAARRTAIYADRNELARKLKDSYWVLDPYIRARSIFDRVGVLNEGGRLDYFTSWDKPSPTNGNPAATASAPAVVETTEDDVD